MVADDEERMDWIESQVVVTDNAWIVTLCLDIHTLGFRAAIDAARAAPAPAPACQKPAP